MGTFKIFKYFLGEKTAEMVFLLNIVLILIGGVWYDHSLEVSRESTSIAFYKLNAIHNKKLQYLTK